jgi:transcriptional regulator with XRE-family HTH domain
MAAIGGVQATAQRHYESGKRSPRAEYLVRLSAAAFDVQFILTGIRTPWDASQLSVNENTVLNAFRLMNLADRDAVMQLLASMAVSPSRLES